MRIMGHLTDSMDRRYGIVDDGDIEIAKCKMEQFRKKERLIGVITEQGGENAYRCCG